MANRNDNRDEFLRTQRRHVRRCWIEARIVGAIWLAAFCYIATTQSMLGYIPAADRPQLPAMILGVPSWVVWGLFLPWIVLIFVTWLFAAFVLKDDEPFMEFPEGDTNDAAGGR